MKGSIRRERDGKGYEWSNRIGPMLERGVEGKVERSGRKGEEEYRGGMAEGRIKEGRMKVGRNNHRGG